jgi:hypothetical protein
MKRWIIVGGVVAALALVGCSKDEPTASTPTTSASASSGDDTPTTKGGGTTSETLTLNDCLAVGMANLGVISGSSEDGDKLKSFDPPDEVKDAVDVIVANGGIKLDGSGQDEVLAASETVTNWVDAACPDS